MAIFTTLSDNWGKINPDLTTEGARYSNLSSLYHDLYFGSGVLESGDFLVTQNTAPDMTVRVAPGIAYINNSSFTRLNPNEPRIWRVISDSTVSVPINGNSSGNPRITSIFLKFNKLVTPNSQNSNTAEIIAVDGTPAANPVAPSTPSDSLRLADITVPNNASSITNSNITNVARVAGLIPNLGIASGGIIGGELVGTISGGNLTISLVNNITGQAPSPNNPVFVWMGSDFVKIDYALSVTLNPSSSLFGNALFGITYFNIVPSSGTNTFPLFVYLLREGSTIRLGVARVDASVGSAFESTILTTWNSIVLSDSINLSNSFVQKIGCGMATINSTPQFTGIVLEMGPSNNLVYGRWFTYFPIIQGSSSIITNLNRVGKYMIFNRACLVKVNFTCTSSASDWLYYRFPYRMALDVGDALYGACVYRVGSGALNHGFLVGNSGDNAVLHAASGGPIPSGNLTIFSNLTTEIA